MVKSDIEEPRILIAVVFETMAGARVYRRWQTGEKVAAREIARLEPLGSPQELTIDPRISARAQSVLIGAAVNQVSALRVQGLEVGLSVEQEAGEILAKANRTADAERLICRADPTPPPSSLTTSRTPP